MKIKALRQEKRQLRQALSPQQRVVLNRHIAEAFLQSDYYRQAEHLGVYLALPEEVDVKLIIDAAWADGKVLYLPVVLAKSQAMLFAQYCPNTPMTRDAMRIPIPDIAPTTYVNARELDCVITPLVVFDKVANRIGMGGGFYDRTFAFKRQQALAKPHLIGVAFDVQCSEETLNTADWDVPLDAIFTESAYYP